MNEYIWSGENALDPSWSPEEITQRIKEAKARQLKDSASASDNSPGTDAVLAAGICHR
jgi:hypothetical protein